jgi:hypothetical protein
MTDEHIDPDKLRELAQLTSRLPREIEPPADAWQSIRAVLESGSVKPARTLRFWQRPAFLLAAGLALVAGSSLVTARILSNRETSSARVAVTAGARPGVPATLAEFTAVENRYISSANRLSEILDSDEIQLSDETKSKLRESLRVIDAAILEARSALAQDPSNRQLIEMLETSYTHKIDLLERTTEMGRS